MPTSISKLLRVTSIVLAWLGVNASRNRSVRSNPRPCTLPGNVISMVSTSMFASSVLMLLPHHGMLALRSVPLPFSKSPGVYVQSNEPVISCAGVFGCVTFGSNQTLSRT